MESRGKIDRDGDIHDNITGFLGPMLGGGSSTGGGGLLGGLFGKKR